MRVLGVIPARGGSKGILRKNLVPLAGKPLVEFTIRAALGSTCLTRTILSSEDPEIIAFARSLGVDVPFIRPLELAADDASSLAVARHALLSAEDEDGTQYDIVCLLQPTCPLRESADIDSAVQMLKDSDADSVVSLTRVEDPHPVKMMLVSEDVVHPLFPDKWHETVRRQDLPPVFYLNGAIYCVRRAILLERGSLWGGKTLAYVMPADRSVNIDSVMDLRMAESMLGTR